MEWEVIAREGGGWVVAAMLVVTFLRALDTGRIVLGREYERVLTEMSKIAERSETLAQEQRDAIERERAEYRARLERKQAELDRARGGSP